MYLLICDEVHKLDRRIIHHQFFYSENLSLIRQLDLDLAKKYVLLHLCYTQIIRNPLPNFLEKDFFFDFLNLMNVSTILCVFFDCKSFLASNISK